MTGRLAIIAVFLCSGVMQAQTRATVSGAPRSVQIVRVAVPAELADAERVNFEVHALNDFSVIGRGSGSVRPRTNKDVLVTIAVLASARAGTRAAANVFFQSGDRQVGVAIEMTVTPVYGLLLNAPAEVTALRTGEQFAVALRLQNRGNTADTVRLTMEIPAGWRLLSRDTSSLIIPAHATAERMLRIAIPGNTGIGNFFVRTYARSRASQAEALTTLTVGPSINALQPEGPAFRAGVGTVAVQGGNAEAVSQFELSGPLTSSIHIDGRFTTTPVLTGPLVRGLARVGTYVSAPHFTAWTANWRLSAGGTVLTMTDLTGLNAGGRGLAYDLADTARNASVVIARSTENSAAGSDRGELLGAHFEQNFTNVRLGATATHLNGVGLQQQRLTAFAVQARTHRISTFMFGGETAYREYSNGNGMGWSARVHHERTNERADLQVTHAPGGTAAFARAENEVHASFMKAFDARFDLIGSLISASDKSITERDFKSLSIALVPSYRVHDRLRLRSEMRHNTFEVAANPLGFGNEETHVGVGALGLWGGFSFSSDVGIARLSRNVTAPDIQAADHGTRMTGRLSAARPTDIGVFQVEASYERNSPTTGYIPEQFLLTARSDRIEVPWISSRLQLDTEVTLQAWSGVSSMVLLRAGAHYALPFDTDVAVAVERNPLLAGFDERTPWIVAFKIEKSVRLPRVAIGRAHGTVFRDFNGNGKRDAGEPGVPNVGVRRGSARATSGHDGKYRFWEETFGDVSIDPTTLPGGWIVGDRRDGDVALVATTRVEVTLQLGAAERARNIDLSQVVVIARDGQGREWTGRRTSSDVATFDALPVGTYTLDADFSALIEPLRIDSAAPIVVQVAEGSTAQATLPVAGRPLRFRQNRP